MMMIKTLQSMNKNDNNTAVKVISQNNNTAIFSQICILSQKCCSYQSNEIQDKIHKLQ